MMSPDRIAMMEQRMNELAEIARRLEEQEEQDREWLMQNEARARAHEMRIRESEARILESEFRIQASENIMRASDARIRESNARIAESDARLRENDAQLSEINAWMRMHTERMRGSMGEIRAIIRTLTEMQADIARIDAGGRGRVSARARSALRIPLSL